MENGGSIKSDKGFCFFGKYFYRFGSKITLMNL